MAHLWGWGDHDFTRTCAICFGGNHLFWRESMCYLLVTSYNCFFPSIEFPENHLFVQFVVENNFLHQWQVFSPSHFSCFNKKTISSRRAGTSCGSEPLQKLQAFKEREEDKPYVECEEDAAEDEREKVEAGTFQASRTYSSLNVPRKPIWKGIRVT